MVLLDPHICRGPIDDHLLNTHQAFRTRPPRHAFKSGYSCRTSLRPYDSRQSIICSPFPSCGNSTESTQSILFCRRSTSAQDHVAKRSGFVIVLQQQKTAVFHLKHCCKQMYVAVERTSVPLLVASYLSLASYRMLCLGSPYDFYNVVLHHVPTD